MVKKYSWDQKNLCKFKAIQHQQLAMAFDECIPNPSTREYVINSVARTNRWLDRCIAEMNRLNSLPDTINKEQMLFGINQGGCYEDMNRAC